MRVERLTESRDAVLDLLVEEASELVALGRRLATQGRWRVDEPDGDSRSRSVIECNPFGPGRWSVRVPNAVGVVRVGEIQIVIEPKIPLPHLLHLFERSGALPRVDANIAELSTAAALWPLVATWYLTALEQLLRSGLASGYRAAQDELPVTRGRVNAVRTSRAFWKGRIALDCEYEEFDVDIPLNRVLRAAASAIAASAALSWDVRKRAARAMNHMESVGEPQPTDFHAARPERHTDRYAVPIQLARHVLAATGRGIDAGSSHGHAFLIRTPDMVEEALRRIIADALADSAPVAKTTRYLRGSHHSLTPDLSFGERAVGDVKYKLWKGDWDRSDLYQLVAFATGFGVSDALRVGFATTAHEPPVVNVGPVRLWVRDWVCDEAVTPQDAERKLVAALVGWWQLLEAGGRVGLSPTAR